MPKWTREQEIDAESRRAFGDALGSAFIFRDEVPDVSIDGAVEQIEPETRSATGLRYFVQLKGTDDPLASSSLAVPVPVDRATYWRSLTLPVLMVRYFSAGKRLFARWVHNFHLPQTAEDQKSITFRWGLGDEIGTETPAHLAEEARSFLALRSSIPPLPFQFALQMDGPVYAITPAEMRIRLNAEVTARGDVIKPVRDATAATGRLRIEDRTLYVEFPGFTAASFELEENYNPGDDGGQLAIDLLALTAIGFARWGQADAAGRLARTFFARSSLHVWPEAPLILASAMSRARQVRESFEVADDLDSQGDSAKQEASFPFTLAGLYNSRSLSDAELQEFKAMLQRRIDRREERGDLVEAARNYVTLANLHRSLAEPLESCRLYQRALECDPEYAGRQHFWHEYAGVLFGSHRYSESANAYGRAVELGAGSFASVLRADALLFAGRYAESREAFSDALGDDHSFERSAEYILKQSLLDDLIEGLGIKFQERDSEAANVVLDRLEETPEDDIRTLTVEALEADGLSALAWWNLAETYRRAGDEARAGSLFTSAALCYEWDPQAWALATMLTWFHGNVNLVPAIVLTGERMAMGGGLLSRIAEITRDQLEPDERQGFLDALARIVDELGDAPADGFAVRHVNAGADVVTTVLPGATASDE